MIKREDHRGDERLIEQRATESYSAKDGQVEGALLPEGRGGGKRSTEDSDLASKTAERSAISAEMVLK